MTKLLFIFSLLYYLVNMSTQYYIVADKETDCTEDLPARFSYFLESEDAYGEHSEYVKVNNAIHKTLDIFPARAVGFDDNDKEVWLDIQLLRDTLTGYLNSLELASFDSMNLSYDPRKQVRDSLFAKVMFSQEADDKLRNEYTKLDSEILHDTTNPYYYLPPDKKYISGKKLNDDLKSVLAMLDCFSKSGCKKVKIVYE